uniref:RxLR effector protein n=1 Tax=Phytophthora sojae TaxID=67593 RepID=G1FTC2_PHYSO|nr:Avh452 [Phytophthora sojae]AEK81360.1 Avh452 [Phytophthora sojae]
MRVCWALFLAVASIATCVNATADSIARSHVKTLKTPSTTSTDLHQDSVNYKRFLRSDKANVEDEEDRLYTLLKARFGPYVDYLKTIYKVKANQQIANAAARIEHKPPRSIR